MVIIYFSNPIRLEDVVGKEQKLDERALKDSKPLPNKLMSKHRVILRSSEGWKDHVLFNEEVDEGYPGVPHELKLRKDIYEELGSPNIITMTIEPGDKLNDDQEN
jgi:hypothetical protein